MARRTVEQVANRRAWLNFGGVIVPVEELESPVWTSAAFDDCLHHVARWAHVHPTTGAEVITAECGQMFVGRPVAIEDVSFVCGKCLKAIDKHGVTTKLPENLIPDNGCAVSGGKRGRRGPKKA